MMKTETFQKCQTSVKFRHFISVTSIMDKTYHIFFFIQRYNLRNKIKLRKYSLTRNPPSFNKRKINTKSNNCQNLNISNVFGHINIMFNK